MRTCGVPGLPTSCATPAGVTSMDDRVADSGSGRSESRGALDGGTGFVREHAGPCGVESPLGERGIQRPDPVEQRRMRREQPIDTRREQHVRHFFRIGVDQPRTRGQRTDLDEGAAQTLGVASELDGRRVRQDSRLRDTAACSNRPKNSPI